MRVFPKDRDLNEAPDEVELVVDASIFGQPVRELSIRVDQFLARVLKWRSRNSVQNLIKDGYVSVDASAPEHPEGTGVFVLEQRPGRKLRHKSRLKIRIPESNRLDVAAPATADLSILYEDDAVVAVDKPPFLAVHPAGRHVSGTLIQKIYALYPTDGPKSARPRLCHRIDRETSGIVLIGKHPVAHTECMRQFEDREVEKEYLAIVSGGPQLEGGTIDFPLGPARRSSVGLKMAATPDGIAAHTEWRVVERYSECTLIACRLHTGRQHQIRVHMEAIGHPLIGDKLYGPDESYFQRSLDGELDEHDFELLGLPRHALHNHRLVFTSPADNERVEVISPLAADLAEYLEAQS